LVDALVRLGASVTVIDDLSNSGLEHLSGLIELEPARVRFVHGSILEPGAMERAVGSASVVFHLAAVCSVPRSIENPGRSWEVNATGTLRVLEAARHAGVKRVVFSASSSAYGNATTLPVDESMLPSPLSPYAASKVAGERLMQAYAESYGMSTVSLRYFNIFGPRQLSGSPYSGVIPKFVEAAMAGEPLLLNGGGEQSRDFTYVGNAVLANLLAGSTSSPVAGRVLNIGTGTRTTVRELAERVLAAFDRPATDATEAPARMGDVQHSLADIGAARDAIGYRVVSGFDEGLGLTLDWWRDSATPAGAGGGAGDGVGP
jgi:nucleoside-diphosphate-sugar epimerase